MTTRHDGRHHHPRVTAWQRIKQQTVREFRASPFPVACLLVLMALIVLIVLHIWLFGLTGLVLT